MKFIPSEKAGLYLKLKKSLALFIGVGQYFESKTFDWLKLYLTDNNQVEVKLIRSFDEGGITCSDVLSFETLEDIEPDETLKYTGSLNECMDLIMQNFKTDTNCFIVPDELSEIYASLVQKGELGI